MPPKDRIWHTKRRRSRVLGRLRTNPAGTRMFRAVANGSWSGCWAQASRFGASRFVPKIAKHGRIFEINPRRPGLCSPTCPDPDQGEREGPSTSALRPQQARDTRAGRFPAAGHHHHARSSAADADGFGGEVGIGVCPGASRLPPRWIGSNGRLCHRVFTAAVADAPVAAISPPTARAVRVASALVSAWDGALQACLWRRGPPSGRWRLLVM